MFRLILLPILSALTLPNGFREAENRMNANSAYRNHLKNDLYYNPYLKETDYDYKIVWEDDGSVKDSRYYEDYDGKQLLEEYDDERIGRNSRRLFDWISKLFNEKSSSQSTTTAPTTRTLSNYDKDLRERIFLKALHRNLTDVMYRLSETFKAVSHAMDQKESYTILTKGKPQVVNLNNAKYFNKRHKRDTDDSKDEKNDVSDVISTNITTNITVDATEKPCNVTSGRRFGNELTEVKNKLLFYLQESFQEIKSKISSLKHLKEAFSDDVSFRVGYIVANIDTLEVNMMNWKHNMDRNKEVWDDGKILELYDTLKTSNQAVSGLIEVLKKHLERVTPQSRKQVQLYRPEGLWTAEDTE